MKRARTRHFEDLGIETSGPTLPEAKRAWRVLVERAHRAARLQAVLVCGDGTIITVPGGFEEGVYLMHREAAPHPSAVLSSSSWEDTVVSAYVHAGTFGGVTWSSGIPVLLLERARSKARENELDHARFWLMARDSGVHPGHNRASVMEMASRYEHLRGELNL